MYARTGGARNERLLVSMKEALKSIAEADDERNDSFPLDIDNPTSGICRLSAYLHIFHHQARWNSPRMAANDELTGETEPDIGYQAASLQLLTNSTCSNQVTTRVVYTRSKILLACLCQLSPAKSQDS